MSRVSLSHSPSLVVRCLFGDRHVVRMALDQAGHRNADEARIAAQRLNILRADIAHARSQPADQLEQRVAERAFVGYHALDPFGNQLLTLAGALEVPITTAALHRANRTHATLGFVAAALIQDCFAGALFGAS